MKFKLFTLFATGVLWTFSAITAQAAPKGEASASSSPTTSPVSASTRPIPFNGRVFSLDKIGNTFSTQNSEKKIRVFSITGQTRITRNNKPAAFEELRVGQEIRGSALKEGNGYFEVLSANIVTKEEATKAIPAGTP